MPKSKKKQKQNKANRRLLNQSYNVILDNRIKAGLTVLGKGKYNAPIPPGLMEPEDFSKDLLDIGDSSNNFTINSISDISAMTSTYNKTTITTPKFIGQKIPVNMREDIVKIKGTGQIPATNVNKKGISSKSNHIPRHIPPPTRVSPRNEASSAHVQSNQLLKDCLSSDIKTVVQDNIKTTVHTQIPQINNPFVGIPPKHVPLKSPIIPYNTPRGVPRSFLTRANQTVIEPQLLVAPDPQVQMNLIPIIMHAGIMEQPMFAPIMPDDPQIAHNAQTFVNDQFSTRYSPTDLYSDLGEENKDRGQGPEDAAPPDCQPGEKRVSAFDRLGPLAQPKTPKLTINLSFNKEQAVREVVNEFPIEPPPAKVYVPVHERQDVLHSTDDTVMKYVGIWPWAKTICIRRTAKSRSYLQTGGGSDSSPVGYSPTAMMMLKEQMDEIYQRDNTFLAVSVTGYPPTWSKEDVLDTMLDNLKDKSFVPCFIEFNEEECKFLVIRSRAALLAIHALDFRMQKDGVQLFISISQIMLSILQLDFIPRLILRKRLSMIHCEGTKLNLSAFTLQPDVSHFIYYPLSHLNNQIELMKLQTDIIWSSLTELDLSRNGLSTIEGFDLENRMPRLHHLDLSYNYIEKATMLLCCRKLSLHSLKLEGNPLCHDYIDPQRYVTVLKMMFPTLRLLDDMPIRLPGDLPAVQRNFCLHGSAPIIDNFLQLYVPLLDSHMDDRILLSNMYAENAFVTITYRPKSGYDSEFRYPRNLLLFSRVLLEGTREFAEGKPDIEKLLRRWPTFEHDPSSFTVDVMIHNETSTLFRLDGIVKLPSDSLAENDQLLAFSRTIHLRTTNGVEYKITNEMIYWDEPTAESARDAFRRTLVKRKPLGFKFECPPDDECKKRLVNTFMKLTQLEEPSSVRCLELKDWDIREALDYFMKLYKVENFEPLMNPAWKQK